MSSIRMKNEQEYEDFFEHPEKIFDRDRDTYLAVNEKPGVLEGEWNYSRALLIGFETREDFDAIPFRRLAGNFATQTLRSQM